MKQQATGTFVPPVQTYPTGPSAPVAMRNVEVVRRENSTAGMGAFMFLTGALVIGLCGWQMTVIDQLVIAIALAIPMFAGVGIAVTGALNFWRHSIDELNDWKRISEKDKQIRLMKQRINELVDYSKDLEHRLSEYAEAASATVKIVGRDGSATLPKWDALDAVIHRWLTDQIFNEAGRLVGVHRTNMQVARAMPFKLDQPGLSGQAYRRAAALGLVRKEEHGYIYTGPLELSGALSRLQVTQKEE